MSPEDAPVNSNTSRDGTIAIESRDCCSVRASRVMSHWVGAAASDWSDCKPAMDGRYLPI